MTASCVGGLILVEKMDIWKRVEKGETWASVIAEFKIGSAVLCDVKKQKDARHKLYSVSTKEYRKQILCVSLHWRS